MIKLFSALLALVLLGYAPAHAQEAVVLPNTNLGAAKPPDLSKDMVNLYASHREAALAAFQAGYKSATATERRPERAMGLFLLSLRRDPTLAKSLYNLAVLCAQGSRWEDAISFQREFQMQPDLDPAWLKSSTAELERLRTISQLEGTPEGKIRRRFDSELWLVLHMTDSVKAINEISRLAPLDSTRWEAPALKGIFQAETGAFSDSVKALDEAAGLAKPDRRANIKLAADAARREATFADQWKAAEAFWEKQQYEPAAKAYEAAWNTIPARLETGMQAATGFLMADKVVPAVAILSRMREYAPTEKISAMLRELGVVSEDARAAAGRTPAAPQLAPAVEIATLIRTLIGPLANSEVELVVRPAAPVLPDTTTVTPIPDEEVDHSDMTFLYGKSIFALYKRDLTRAADLVGGGVGFQAPAAPAIQPVSSRVPPVAADAPPARAPNSAPAGGSPESAGKGQEQSVSLKAKTYHVYVQSKTQGLALSVNGKPTAKVTPAEFDWAEGEYTIDVEIDGKLLGSMVSIKEGGDRWFRLQW